MGSPKPSTRIAAVLSTILAGAAITAWPALFNRFPLTYPDAMTYLWDGSVVARALFLHQTAPFYGMRSFVYSLVILPLHLRGNPWPIVALNALLVASVLWLVVRSIRPARIFPIYLALVASLAVLTSMSWYASLLMPDILGPILYLSIYLLIFARDTLAPWERIALYPIVWWSIASHTTHLLLATALVMILAVMRRKNLRPVAEVAGLILLAAAANLAIHAHLYGKPSLNGDRPPFLTARVISDGPGRRFLMEHCAENAWAMCAHRDHLTDDVDNFLWGDDGIWQNAPEPEQALILKQETPFVLATLRAYPRQQITRSLLNAWNQLLDFGYGDLDPSGYVLVEFDHTIPASRSRYLNSRQYQNKLPLDLFARIDYATVTLSALVVAILLPLALRRHHRRITGLAVIIISMVLLNACITGAMSMVDPRFEARVIWLIPLLAGLLALDLTANPQPKAQT